MMKSVLKHFGKKPSKFNFSFEIHEVVLPLIKSIKGGDYIKVSFERGTKCSETEEVVVIVAADSSEIKIIFEETLSLSVTLYKGKDGAYQEKLGNLVVLHRKKNTTKDGGKFAYKKVGTAPLFLHQLSESSKEYTSLPLLWCVKDGAVVNTTITATSEIGDDDDVSSVASSTPSVRRESSGLFSARSSIGTSNRPSILPMSPITPLKAIAKDGNKAKKLSEQAEDESDDEHDNNILNTVSNDENATLKLNDDGTYKNPWGDPFEGTDPFDVKDLLEVKPSDAEVAIPKDFASLAPLESKQDTQQTLKESTAVPVPNTPVSKFIEKELISDPRQSTNKDGTYSSDESMIRELEELRSENRVLKEREANLAIKSIKSDFYAKETNRLEELLQVLKQEKDEILSQKIELNDVLNGVIAENEALVREAITSKLTIADLRAKLEASARESLKLRQDVAATTQKILKRIHNRIT